VTRPTITAAINSIMAIIGMLTGMSIGAIMATMSIIMDIIITATGTVAIMAVIITGAAAIMTTVVTAVVTSRW
jgi:hypothetical protein